MSGTTDPSILNLNSKRDEQYMSQSAGGITDAPTSGVVKLF